MSEERKCFEEWWTRNQANTPVPWDLKEMFWLAFSQGWYKRGKLA